MNPTTPAVPDLPFTMADAFSIFQDLTEAMDAVSKGHQDAEEIARLMLKKTDSIHYRFLSATQPAPSGDAVEVLREALDEATRKFRYYEAQHRAKGTEDSAAKAEVNADLAGRFEAIIATTSRAATVAKDGGKTGTRPTEAFAYANKVVNDKMLPQFRGQTKPEASAANQQAGRDRNMGLLDEALHWIENSTENAPSLCGDIRKALGLSAAPISEGTKGTATDWPHDHFNQDASTAPAASNGDALPPKPKCKMLSGSNLDSLHALYTADQMDAYVLADRAARAGTGSAGSIGDDAEFNRLVMCIAAAAERKGGYPKERQDLVAYIDTRATKVEAAPGNAGEGVE